MNHEAILEAKGSNGSVSIRESDLLITKHRMFSEPLVLQKEITIPLDAIKEIQMKEPRWREGYGFIQFVYDGSPRLKDTLAGISKDENCIVFKIEQMPGFSTIKNFIETRNAWWR